MNRGGRAGPKVRLADDFTALTPGKSTVRGESPMPPSNRAPTENTAEVLAL